jgi:hypothetical protein
MTELHVIKDIIGFRTEELKNKRFPTSIKLSEETAKALFKEMRGRGWTKTQFVSPKGFWSFFGSKPMSRLMAVIDAETWKDLEGSRLYGMDIHICKKAEAYDL